VIPVASLNLNVALDVRQAGVWTLSAPLAVLSAGSFVVLPLLYRRSSIHPGIVTGAITVSCASP
jgi:hypothetical protein